MSTATVLNTINAIIAGQTELNPVGREIARLVFLMRRWQFQSVRLEGSTDKATRRNINRWLQNFENTFGESMINIGFLSGYGGFSLTNKVVNQTTSIEIFKQSYQNTLARINAKDLTQARLLRNSLGNRWKKSWKDFYKQYDEFLIESQAIGLSVRETTTKFLNVGIGKNTTSIIDSAGRLWKPETYSHMYANTRASEIQNEIQLDEMDEIGMDIVQVSNHGTLTPICKQFEGKYYSLNGATPGISILPARTPFHPNCKHILLPVDRRSQQVMVRNNRTKDRQISNFNKDLTTSQKKTAKNQLDWNQANRK